MLAVSNSLIEEDDNAPRMLTWMRNGKELSCAGAADGPDASRKLALMVLLRDEGLRVGDQIVITRI